MKINIGATLKKLFSTSEFYTFFLSSFLFGFVFLYAIQNPIAYFFGDEFDVEIIQTERSGGRSTNYFIYFNYEGKICQSVGWGRDNYGDIKVGDVVKMRKCKSIDKFVASCSCVWLMFFFVLVGLIGFCLPSWCLYLTIKLSIVYNSNTEFNL